MRFRQSAAALAFLRWQRNVMAELLKGEQKFKRINLENAKCLSAKRIKFILYRREGRRKSYEIKNKQKKKKQWAGKHENNLKVYAA